MTTREFFSKHYGSLSAGAFGIGLLVVLGVFGDRIGTFTKAPAPPPQATAPAAEAPPSETPPPEEAQPAPDENAEPEKDPLQEALAAEAAKAEERREAVRTEINKGREEAGLPPLPAQEQTETNGQF